MPGSNVIRCINLDWLEVHCLEPNEPRNAEYFIAQGYRVQCREYGTRIYREMFTILDEHDNGMVEVRRSPKSQLHSDWECHVRLVNAYCYLDNAAGFFRDFLDTYGFIVNRISRVDICLDFSRFDSGDHPDVFLQRYVRRKYSKINQANVHAHGSDTWDGRHWNSISWGSPTSDVGTKMYDKTLELYDPITDKFGKPYIRYAWLMAGLIDDFDRCTLKGEKQQIWRVEFSIRSSVKKWFKIELNGIHQNYQSIYNTLDMYDTRAKLLTMFASLANHYFRFKKYKDGVRKDRCPDKPLFYFKGEQHLYKIEKTAITGSGKINRPLSSLISKLRDYRDSHIDRDIRQACGVLIKAMENEFLRDETGLFTPEEIQAFRIAISIHSRNPSHDAAVLLREVKKLLRINDNTVIF